MKNLTDNISVCFATDDKYSSHLAVAISSLLSNTNTERGIDIYILASLKKRNMRKLASLENLRGNVSIKFLNVDKSMFRDFPLLNHSDFSLATYYRFVIPKLLHKIDKLVYLDCDLIVKDDIEELYNIDIGDNYIGAVQDIVGFGNQRRLNLTKGKYYCNAGVLLMNLESMRRDNIAEKLISWTNANRSIIKWNDQDVINVVLEDKIYYLDLAWNFQHVPDCSFDFNMDEFKQAMNAPKIVHYVGGSKPWDFAKKRVGADLYFKYLKSTPYRISALTVAYRKVKYIFGDVLLKNIFSLKNSPDKSHKILLILGVKFYINRKK